MKTSNEMDVEALAYAKECLNALHGQVMEGKGLSPELFDVLSYIMKELERLDWHQYAIRRETVSVPEWLRRLQ